MRFDASGRGGLTFAEHIKEKSQRKEVKRKSKFPVILSALCQDPICSLSFPARCDSERGNLGLLHLRATAGDWARVVGERGFANEYIGTDR